MRFPELSALFDYVEDVDYRYIRVLGIEFGWGKSIMVYGGFAFHLGAFDRAICFELNIAVV
jgi:hypothetical protein